MNRAHVGRAGEDAALLYLEAQGMRLLGRNFRAPGGEIDLILEDGCCTVFVEVKARSTGAYGLGREAVTRGKMARICRVACAYLTQENRWRLPVRFDVVELSGGELVHLANAFPFLPPSSP